MTRPLVEPTSLRKLAGAQFDIAQLQRRPGFPLNLPWGYADDSGSTTVVSGVSKYVSVGSSLGTFYTNDPEGFEIAVSPTGPLYEGLHPLRHGTYIIYTSAVLSRSAAITHGTKRAALSGLGPAGNDISSHRVDLNVGEYGGGIDASPQVWSLFTIRWATYSGLVVEDDPLSMLLQQESGGNAFAECNVFAIRVSGNLPF